MIKIKQLGSNVKVTLNPEIDDKVMELNWGTNDEWYAHLLCERLNKVLCEKVESARREAYEQGYTHGKGKKAKQTWFSTKL